MHSYLLHFAARKRLITVSVFEHVVTAASLRAKSTTASSPGSSTSPPHVHLRFSSPPPHLLHVLLLLRRHHHRLCLSCSCLALFAHEGTRSASRYLACLSLVSRSHRLDRRSLLPQWLPTLCVQSEEWQMVTEKKDGLVISVFFFTCSPQLGSDGDLSAIQRFSQVDLGRSPQKGWC